MPTLTAEQHQVLAEYRKLRRIWRGKPDLYARQRLGLTPTDQQRRALRAMATPGARVSARAGHNVGKTAFTAATIWWFLECFDYAKVPCTAPSRHQLETVLWAELAKWQRRSDQVCRKAGVPETDERIGNRTYVRNTTRGLRQHRPRGAALGMNEGLGIAWGADQLRERSATGNPSRSDLGAGNTTGHDLAPLKRPMRWRMSNSLSPRRAVKIRRSSPASLSALMPRKFLVTLGPHCVSPLPVMGAHPGSRVLSNISPSA